VISIITRCLNRLEYTTQVIDAVKQRTKIPYEHIIVDNASSDGTKEWFKWMNINTSWYSNLKYYRMDSNLGDWGGMLAGAKQAKGEYIVQLDNDIIPCEGWLSSMLTVLMESDYKVVMLKRDNVAWRLKPLSTVHKIGDLDVVRVERAVACYMMSKKDFDTLNIPKNQGMKSKYKMAKKLHPIGKILNRTCIELQADFQRQKYNPKNPQVWETV
jgi:glycosyltransferase involved in cell wall biosynthesis